MARNDRMSALFFVGLAVAIVVEAIRMGRGSLSNPGPGLIPLGCGIVIGVLSLIVFAGTFRGASREGVGDKAFRLSWKTVTALVSMVVFGFLVNPLGFYTATFLWLGFVCRWIGRMGWKTTVLLSVVATFFTWLLFGYLLEIRFPRGIMGF